MSAPEQPDVVFTDGSAATFAAVFAGKYHDADLAVWRYKTAIGDREPMRQEVGRLEHLRAERRATYFDLVAAVYAAEAERLKATE